MCKKMINILCAVLLIAAPHLAAFAQSDVSTATLKGTVTDPTGAVVVGATVTAKSVDRGTARTDKTNAEGLFQIPSLQPGLYQLRIEAQGFETAVVNNLQLSIGQTALYDAQLKVGAVTSIVEINTEAPVVEVERTQQANTIESRQIENLPNIGRGFTAYVFTLPGVSSSDAPRVQGGARFNFASSGFSIGGGSGRNNLITVDGGENEYGSGQLRFAISPEAVQEFQVNRNSFAAEFGFTSGTAVNVVTKGGGNSFHGSGYIFYRSNRTSAREFFDLNAKKAFQRQVYPGFSFGGPLVKNKLFFFTNYERQQLDLTRFRNYLANPLLNPSATQAALLARFQSSGNATLQRIGANLANKLTTTASTFPATYKLLAANNGSFNAPYRLNSWITRVDYQMGNNDTITGRFSMARNFNSQLTTDFSESPSGSTDLSARDYTTLVTWTHNFGSSLVNIVRAQFSPKNSAVTVPHAPGSTSLLITGLGNFNRPFLTPFNTFQDRYQFEDTLSWLKGAHTFKFGASFRPVKYKVDNQLWFGGEWNFSSAVYPLVLAVPAADQTAFVVGVCQLNGIPLANCNATTAGGSIPGTALTSLQSFNNNLPFLYRQGFGNSIWQDSAKYLGTFAQDSWKVSQRLTLDYGFRVDYDGEPAPAKNRTYFSPRLGFAWDLFGDRSTVVRGGGGIFYAPIPYQVIYVTNLLNDSGKYINQVFRTPSPAFPANQRTAAIWAAGLAAGKLPFGTLGASDLQALGISTGPKGIGRVAFELDPNYKNTYSIQANLAIQRKLSDSMALELAYQLYRGVHLQLPHARNYREALNPAARCAGLNPMPLACSNPAAGGPIYEPIDPTLTQQTVYASIGNSIYHGVTASLTRRFSNFISFQGSYTYSKTIDDVTDYNSAFYAPFPTRLNLDRAVSSFDIRHNFVFSGVFASPYKRGEDSVMSHLFADMSLSPILSLRSGIPFTLYTGVDINGDTRGANDRLFYVPRNSGLGPNFASFDARISKSFFFAKDRPTRLEFTVEGVNLLNHTNFASVNDIVGSSPALPDYNRGTFSLKGDKNRGPGQPLSFTSAFDPRRIQFGLKFAF
ncbi:MAG: TonB-dependent receptor [Acidobacteria bacterium]|nr:TonB-dependent receptor [Acidobacteriota bacterium]